MPESPEAHRTRRDQAAELLERSALAVLLRRVRAWRGLLVLNYHQIAEDRGALDDPGLWSATPDGLDRQLAFLKRHFEIVGPEALERGPRRGRPQVMLTFDDGYRNNYELAYPILREHDVHATFFLATGFIDQPRLPWWDEIALRVRESNQRELAPNRWLPSGIVLAEPDVATEQLLAIYKGLPGTQAEPFLVQLAEATGGDRRNLGRPGMWITWDMAREMRAGGMAIGGHTVNHPVLARLSEDDQRNEIAGCRRRIEAEIGEAMRLFSYPVGLRDSFDEVTRETLRGEGVDFAFSYYGGHNTRGEWSPHDIRRVSVSATDGLPLFRATTTLPQLFARW